ncbi:MAG: peptidyl-prolyl cis-trans isomerase [Rhodospirillaceae bacterium]|jgi:cyclophilin family peptidyl-prolyl cis-trans isomerase|nr:peptidyl-prolyl cis-trans isomerase [Rhodospirillaceae bacterium]MBT4938775.1 peptidyl-prolyl cis-trans isomerase [Rhodospirillaceae bacterium]MBT7957491.1 peptidyl-prolyl cis-trans isomerase [Rhodospirillaceae bacterium]
MKNLIMALLPFVAAFAIAGNLQAAGKPKVHFKTNVGDFTIELEPEKAPQTVANFLQYVRDGHYDGMIFHRVIKAFMVQGGGFDKSYNKKPTREPIPNEADKGIPNERGTIAMARTGDPHSATNQFFINVKFNGFLNYRSKTQQGWGYTAFGRVIDGMNIVGRISRMETGPAGPFPTDVPTKQVFIEKAKIISE